MASVEVGPACTKHGITPSILLSGCGLFELNSITNEIVLELARFKDRHSQCTLKDVYLWIKDLFGSKWPEQPPNQDAVTQSIKRLSAGLSKLKKCSTSTEKEGKIIEYLQHDYVLPHLGFHKGKIIHFSVAKQSSRSEKELKQKMYAITRNANKRLKRREAVISEQKNSLESQQKKIKMYEKKLQGTETQLTELRAKISRVSHRAAYWRGRVDSVQEKASVKQAKLQEELKMLKKEISALDSELIQALESVCDTEEIATFEGGKYTDNVRTCVYDP